MANVQRAKQAIKKGPHKAQFGYDMLDAIFIQRVNLRKEEGVLNLHENQGGAVGDVNLNVLISAGPGFRGREVPTLLVANATVTSKAFLVRVEQNLVLTRLGNCNAVVGKGPCRVEVEDEDCSRAVERQDLVALVFPRDICLLS